MLAGRVTDRDTGQPLQGATVLVDPGGFELLTDTTGDYVVSLGEGRYSRVVADACGYVPTVMYWHELGSSAVEVGTTTTLDFPLKPVPPVTSNVVTLEDGDSYHFLAQEKGRYTGGDFYLGGSEFWANNRGQRGVQDLGDLGDLPLDEVVIPESGYIWYGVPVVAGHTHVSLARDGEQGHFVVFRVQEAVPDDHITLEYLYTPSEDALCSGPMTLHRLVVTSAQHTTPAWALSRSLGDGASPPWTYADAIVVLPEAAQ